MNPDECEIIAASADALLGIHARPTFARVVGAVHTACVFRLHHRIHAFRIAGCDGNADPAQVTPRRQSLGQFAPGLSAILGLVKPAAGRAIGIAGRPGWTTRSPQHGVDRLRIARVEREISAADVIVFGKHLLPGLSAIERAINSALSVRAVRMSHGRYKHTIRIVRIDEDGADLLRVTQSKVLPGLAGIGGFVDSISYREIGPAQSFAAAHVNDVRIRRCDRQSPDGAGRLIVEDRSPCVAKVSGLPDTAIVGRHVKHILLSRNACDGHRAPASKWADHAPAHPLIQFGTDGLREHCDAEGTRQTEEEVPQNSGKRNHVVLRAEARINQS